MITLHYMRCFPITLVLVTALATVACSGTQQKSPSADEQRARANRTYDSFDEEMGGSPASKNSTAVNVKKAAPRRADDAPVIVDIGDLPQPTIMVMPAKSADGTSELEVVSKNPFSKSMMEAINGYLTHKQYEVRSLEGQSDLDNVIQMQNDIAGSDEDLSYIAGLALGADVYIKFSGAAQTDQVVVEISAYETSTARLLGSQTSQVKNNGHVDQNNIRANLQSAARKAMPNLENKILNYWKADMQNGIQYKVVMNLKGDFSDSQTEDLQDDILQTLKASFNKVVVNVMTAKTIDLVVYADPAKFTDSQDVYSFIRRQIKNQVETKKINISKKLILMELR